MSYKEYKKFIVFGWNDYYPAGGTGDIQASFDTTTEVENFLRKNYYENVEVIYRDTWESVFNRDSSVLVERWKLPVGEQMPVL